MEPSATVTTFVVLLLTSVLMLVLIVLMVWFFKAFNSKLDSLASSVEDNAVSLHRFSDQIDRLGIAINSLAETTNTVLALAQYQTQPSTFAGQEPE